MKEIKTLVPDIYQLMERRDGWFTEKLAEDLSRSLSSRLLSHFNPSVPQRTGLRLSRLGPRCPCALWYEVHHPEMAEPLPPWATIKYSYGHVLEAMAICLAKAAGHEVTGEQDELVLDGIIGHRDCVIDGCVVDVKSCSSRQFDKYKSRTIALDDSFGYLDQLDAYVGASADDPLVRVKDRGYILAIDKTLGHMVLYEHKTRNSEIRSRIRSYKRICESRSPPKCLCGTISEGKSGNVKLDTRASYSLYKHCCFPSLRTCIGSDGTIRWFSHVEKWPTYQGKPLREVDKHGNIVYN